MDKVPYMKLPTVEKTGSGKETSEIQRTAGTNLRRKSAEISKHAHTTAGKVKKTEAKEKIVGEQFMSARAESRETMNPPPKVKKTPPPKVKKTSPPKVKKTTERQLWKRLSELPKAKTNPTSYKSPAEMDETIRSIRESMKGGRLAEATTMLFDLARAELDFAELNQAQSQAEAERQDIQPEYLSEIWPLMPAKMPANSKLEYSEDLAGNIIKATCFVLCNSEDPQVKNPAAALQILSKIEDLTGLDTLQYVYDKATEFLLLKSDNGTGFIDPERQLAALREHFGFAKHLDWYREHQEEVSERMDRATEIRSEREIHVAKQSWKR